MAKGLFAFILLFGIVALGKGNEAISSLDLSDSDDSRLGEMSSAFISNINYNGGGDDYEDDYEDDEYEDDEYEDDGDSNGQISINLSFDAYDSRPANAYYDKRNSYYEEYEYRYLRCYQCYQYCSSYHAYYNCDGGNNCYCIPTQQTSTTSSYGPQRLPGNNCQAYYVQIIGSGLGGTCDAFCKTIGLGKLIGVCIYNQCTCEAMQQYSYPYNGNSGYQPHNRQYRSIEVSNNTVNIM